MRQSSTRLLAIILALTTFPVTALAQPTEQEPNVALPIVTKAAEPPPGLEVVLQQQLEDYQARSKRARNALIGTSATVGVGIAFIAIGNSQCQVISRPGQSDLFLCNTAGDVLWGLGMGMAISGALGVITSGIILGVANKRKRQIQRDMRQRYSHRKLRWDVPSGGFVF
jgi:hypothetical protein